MLFRSNATATDDYNPKFGVAGDDDGVVEAEDAHAAMVAAMGLPWGDAPRTAVGVLVLASAAAVGHAEEGEELENVPEAEKQKELHYGEAWFHGRLQGGRHAAEALLRQHLPVLDPSAREGVFLVRESETFLGEFSLSFWREHGEQPRHSRDACVTAPTGRSRAPMRLPQG